MEQSPDKNKEDVDFKQKLIAETLLLKQWFAHSSFTEEGLRMGAEIELFLLDEDLNPSPKNLQFISEVHKEYLIPEVGAAHLEINTPHYRLTKNCFSLLHQNILQSLNHCRHYAERDHRYLALIGSLPTATGKHHQLSYLTQKHRYNLINSSMKEHNNGPIKISIDGVEPMQLEAESLAINGLLSAFQMHLQVGLSQSVRYYNIAQIIAGPLLALSANSPFFFNHFLWHESRVFIFNEVMTLNAFQNQKEFHCCLFGENYLQSSFFELFKKNIHFPRLISEIQDSPKEKMFHVRQQNGVIYRWNRPVIDFNQQGVPHLRIEHRGPPSGPTVVDMVANSVFYYGLMHYFYESSELIETLLPFVMAKKNFFNAAKYGLNASFYWGEHRHKVKASEVLKNLIPQAKKGLMSLNIDSDDIEFYLNILKNRVAKNSNGSNWQLQFVQRYGKDFSALLSAYLEYQYRDVTVSEWKF
jgi:gamma-glutamyl:cysteine ligase YbdK (ATP-grasp superfamily)